jgi:hypothetical protein
MLLCFAVAPSALAQKRVIYLFDSNPATGEAPVADHALHDQNIMNALSGGVTAEGTPITGLGYQIIQVDLETQTDVADYTSTDGDLIFISNSVNSGDPGYHLDDSLPLINTEAALMNNSDDPPRCEMLFGSGEGSPNGTEFNIVVTTHPITSIFTAGNLAIGIGDGELGYAGGTLATNVTFLAEVPGNAGQKVLGVAEANSAGLVAPGGGIPAGVEPLPARRAILGYHAAAFTTPTVNGVYLLQRTVQWAIGDPVTAGGPTATTPTAPTNLTAAAGNATVLLNWDPVPETIDGYRVYESTTSGTGYTEIATVGSGVTEYLATGLTNGTTYYYVVAAFNAAGEGPMSNEASATPDENISLRSRYWHLYDGR